MSGSKSKNSRISGNRRLWDTTGRPFVRGPIPLDWVARAAGLGLGALCVGLECWRCAWLDGSLQFRLNLSRVGVAPGLARSSARLGLRRLEQGGLVTVARPAGQRVIVSIQVELRERGLA